MNERFILFLGDFYTSDKTYRFSPSVLDFIKSHKILVVNLEGVLKPKTFIARSKKSSLLEIAEGSLNQFINQFNDSSILVFTLANNHIHDYGVEGIMALKNFLKKYPNVRFTGVGTYDELIEPTVLNLQGYRIGLFCVSTSSPEVMSVCDTSCAQHVLELNSPEVVNILRDTKSEVDFMVIIPHWGIEYMFYPTVNQRRLASLWLRNGANMVIGHHVHLIQGVEFFKEKSCYYSLGNFVFDDFYLLDGVKKSWRGDSCLNIAVSLNSEFVAQCVGLEFCNNKYSIDFNENALKLFEKRSRLLDYLKIGEKNYYRLWEDDYFRLLKNNRGLFRALENYFPEHKSKSRISYFISLIENKLKLFFRSSPFVKKTSV